MTAVTATRIDGLDRLRGAAVLLMVVDHVCAVFGVAGLLRVTVTRAAAPAFMSVVGALGPRGWRRWVNVAALGVLETGLLLLLGLPQPGIVVVLAVVGPAWSWARRRGVNVWLLVLLGWWQWSFAGLPYVGYQPGFVLLWLGVGEMAREGLAALGARLPAWCSTIGRRPRQWYLAHLSVLAVLPK